MRQCVPGHIRIVLLKGGGGNTILPHLLLAPKKGKTGMWQISVKSGKINSTS